MIEAILTLNTGSSSVKFSLFERRPGLALLAHGEASGLPCRPHLSATEEGRSADHDIILPDHAAQEDALHAIFDWVHGHEKQWRITAVAHRIVHGGELFTSSTRLSSGIVTKLEKLIPLAPRHQPHNLAGIALVEKLLPHVQQVACFDTAFHAAHEPLFTAYAISQALTDRGIRRYGFHGLSYEWIAYRLHRDSPELDKRKVVAAHLGSGASLCAMQNGVSIDSSMGMTALDGMPMGTRCGNIDAGAVLYMAQTLGMPASEIERCLYEESGLKGLSGIGADVRLLQASSEPQAKFALDYFALKAAQFIAMMAVSLGGIDGVVFTGGIGEHSAPMRESIMARVAFLKIPIVLVVAANEERIMAISAMDRLEGLAYD